MMIDSSWPNDQGASATRHVPPPGDGVLSPTVTAAVLMLFTEATTPIREAL
jgi:hypothetical protein